MLPADRIPEILERIWHALEVISLTLLFAVGILYAARHIAEWLADTFERVGDKDLRYRIRTTIVKDMMDEQQTQTAKLRRLRVSKNLQELILDPWPNIIPERQPKRQAKLTHFYSVPGRLGTQEVAGAKKFLLQLGRDEVLKKHREYSTLLVYTLGEPLTEILSPPGFVAVQPVGKECLTYEAHFPPERKFVRNKNLDDPYSKEEPRIKVYRGNPEKTHELMYVPYGWTRPTSRGRRLWTKAKNKFRTRYHVIGGRTDFGDGHGEHDWFRVTVFKPPQKADIHICWCMQEDPVGEWKWCTHSAADHRKDDDQLIESARATFRKLAVFEVDAKRSRLARLNWDKNKYLLAAADAIDELYWLQGSVDGDNRSLLDQIGDDEELREIFLFNRGPYDRFNDNQPFLDVKPEFSGKGFYPPDFTRQEFTDHIRRYRDSEGPFESPYTVIRRTGGKLSAVPYHNAYHEPVERLSGLLQQASEFERHDAFRAFLAQRAKDLLTDDYTASETLWVTLEDNPIDLVIGPYEVYEDGLMGLKAAYEAILFERDFIESEKILHIQNDLAALCKRTESELRRPLFIPESRVRISVANLIYAGGEARKSVPAIAFSLPNDEKVIEEVGSRQVILKNVIEAKFNLVAHKIANRVLEEPLYDKRAAFQDFFKHTLFHEVSHSLGPQRIVVNGESTTVNRCLKQYHSVLEEAKADTLGACLALNAEQDLDATYFLRGYFGCLIRSIRFGLDQAHGGANAIQFNYLLQERAFTCNKETGKLSIDKASARVAVFKLAAQIIDIQERGDFAAARSLVTRFCVTSPEIAAVEEIVKDLPIDIRIRYLDWTS